MHQIKVSPQSNNAAPPWYDQRIKEVLLNVERKINNSPRHTPS